jgi:hypothetical protein
MQRFDPPLARPAQWAAAAAFALALAATSLLLWHAHEMTLTAQALGTAAIVALLWLIGSLTQPRAAGAARQPVAAP